MFESLLRRLWTAGWRRGRAGSRPWMVVAVATGGIRLFRHFAREREEVLYRTRVVPGDQFEVVATRPAGKGRRK